MSGVAQAQPLFRRTTGSLAGKRVRREGESGSSKALARRSGGNNGGISTRHRGNRSNNSNNNNNGSNNNSNNNENGSARVERHPIRRFGIRAAPMSRLPVVNNGSAGAGGVPRAVMQASAPGGTLRRSPQQTSLQSLPQSYMQGSNNNSYGSNNNLAGAFGNMRLGLPLGNSNSNNNEPRPMSTLPVERPIAAPVARRPLSTVSEGPKESSSGGAKRRRRRSTKKVTKRKSGSKVVKRKSSKSRKSKKRV
jgi:hypothetical protein